MIKTNSQEFIYVHERIINGKNYIHSLMILNIVYSFITLNNIVLIIFPLKGNLNANV